MSAYKEVFTYIRSDYHRYTGNGFDVSIIKLVLAALIAKNHCFAYSFWLRLSSRRTIFYLVARWMNYRLSRKYGMQISPKTKIGYGLYIGHGVGIIVSHTAIIGNNCNLSQFTTIGSNRSRDNSKSSSAAIIGDNVYIGPSVCIVGNVHIHDNVTIGAGAVVVKDISENATVVGVPAKVVSYDESGRFVNKRWST